MKEIFIETKNILKIRGIESEGSLNMTRYLWIWWILWITGQIAAYLLNNYAQIASTQTDILTSLRLQIMTGGIIILFEVLTIMVIRDYSYMESLMKKTEISGK